MEQNQNGLRLDITTIDYVLDDLSQFIENELKEVAENTAEDIIKLPLYEISQSEIRIQIYESVKESLTDFKEMYEAKIEQILIDMEEQEEQAGQPEANPCDYPDNEGHFNCPFDANGPDDCRRNCGLGVDE